MAPNSLQMPRKAPIAPLVGAAVLLFGITAATNWEQLVAFKRDKNLSAKETADSVTRVIALRLTKGSALCRMQ